MKTHIDNVSTDQSNKVKMGWFEHGTSRIYYEEEGNGEPVLLLPGWAGSIEEFSVVRQGLVAASYRVIAADLPGSGRSQPQPRAYTATYFEDDARSFVALLEHLAVGAAHLMGFSDGGDVSLLMAALIPGIARSVVTWGAAGVLSDPDGHLRGAMSNVVDNPIPPLQPFRDYLVASYGEANARAMAQSVVGAISAIIEAGGDVSLSKSGNITCATLLMVGEHDMFVTSTLVSQLADHINKAQVLKVEGAGHDVHNTHPEWMVQTIINWLKKN